MFGLLIWAVHLSTSAPESVMVCPQCRARLVTSGQEPNRYICEKCGQDFLLCMTLVPVPPARPLVLLETNDVAASNRSR